MYNIASGSDVLDHSIWFRIRIHQCIELMRTAFGAGQVKSVSATGTPPPFQVHAKPCYSIWRPHQTATPKAAAWLFHLQFHDLYCRPSACFCSPTQLICSPCLMPWRDGIHKQIEVREGEPFFMLQACVLFNKSRDHSESITGCSSQ